MELPMLLSKKDLAQLFGVTPRCIEKWIKFGMIPEARHIGRLPFWERDSFLVWMKNEFKVEGTAEPTRKGRPRNPVNRFSAP